MKHFFARWLSKAEPQQAVIRPFDTEISVGPQQTLLEAALQQGVAFPHNCTVGTCASCKCRLVSGKVRAGVDFGYTLSKAELDAGYILACQAHPLSPVEVVVESAGADAPPPETFRGQITHTAPLTHDILHVKITLDRPMKYVGGQYASLQMNGLPARSYSFADPPDRAGRKEISFFIRLAPGGAFSQPLFDGAFDGKELAVDGPHGTFSLRAGEGPLICVAGGSGLAPLMSLLMDARKKNIKRPCHLFFGARTQRDLYLIDAIEGMAGDWLSEFKFFPVLSSEPADSDWTGKRGLITEALAEALAGAPQLAQSGQAYMCGPPPMIDSAIEVLTKSGVALNDIHYDKFTDAKPKASG